MFIPKIPSDNLQCVHPIRTSVCDLGSKEEFTFALAAAVLDKDDGVHLLSHSQGYVFAA